MTANSGTTADAHFEALASAFMPPDRRDRFLLTISSEKRLRKHDIIAHGLESWFTASAQHDTSPEWFDIEAERNRDVWVLDSERSGVMLRLSLEKALGRIEDFSFGTLVSIAPGKLAIYRGEGMDETIWLY